MWTVSRHNRLQALSVHTEQSFVDTAAESWLLVSRRESSRMHHGGSQLIYFISIAWAELGTAMKDKLAIAEVNCEALPALCKKHKITGYPTLNL